MENFESTDPQMGKDRAFKVGLATLSGLILIILIFVIIFVKGCSETEQPKEEAKQESAPVAEEAVQKPIEPVEESSPQEEGEVAGETLSESSQSGNTYTLKPGDTLYEIGLKFDLDWKKIAEVNGIENQAALRPGDEIIIPAD